MNDNQRFPNLFWPIIFIGVGGMFLLANMGLIETIDLNQIWRLWPIFLVVAGINMLFGRNSRWLASLFSGLLALLVVAFLFFAPMVVETLPTPELQTESFSDPGLDVQSADVRIDFDRGNIDIMLLTGSPNLFAATVTHDENVTFSASGISTRNIRLNLDQIGLPPFGDWFAQSRIKADVQLASGVPTDLFVNIGAGSAVMDLADLTLGSLKADSGSGGLSADLPEGDYKVDLSSGSGSITVGTAPNSALDMKLNVGSGKITLTLAEDNTGEINLDSGSGSVTIILPEGLAVELRGETGSGSVRVPDDFIRTAGGDSFSGDGGIWVSPNYDGASEPLVIRFDIGSGTLRVEYP